MPELMTAKILEVFRSIQGEGPYAGIAQVFVRFFECNMHCTWCDTPASIGDTSRNYKEVGLPELREQVKALYSGCHSVSITGGEPLLQSDFLKEFLPALKQNHMSIYLDTNGILHRELGQIIEYVDIVAMDLKLPSSTEQPAYWAEHEEFLKIARRKNVFIKAVISKNTSDADVQTAMELVRRQAPETVFILQPNYFDLQKQGDCVAKCVELQERCARTLSNVRVVPQMHKFLKMR